MLLYRRSREGAWIEMTLHISYRLVNLGRSREGAWIEISFAVNTVILLIGRSREGAWIEMPLDLKWLKRKNVAPVRERGLK